MACWTTTNEFIIKFKPIILINIDNSGCLKKIAIIGEQKKKYKIQKNPKKYI